MPINTTPAALFRCTECGAKGIWWINHLNGEIDRIDASCLDCMKDCHKKKYWSDDRGKFIEDGKYMLFSSKEKLKNAENIEPDKVSYHLHESRAIQIVREDAVN